MPGDVLSRDEILDAIRDYVAENGQPPGLDTFVRSHLVPGSAFSGMYWARWSDAVREAGFEPLARSTKHDRDYVLESLASFTRSLGRFPTRGELRLQRKVDPLFPGQSAFERSIGAWSEQVSALAQWCAERPAYADVLAMLPERPTEPPTDHESTTDDSTAMLDGFVYMLRSGKFFKIGQTSSVPRRWAEIAQGAPEAVELVHYFKTDDRLGIEAYWHRRFAIERRGGEWFTLSARDVAAFKRRSGFM